jgi:recombination protein RecT
MNSPAVRNQSSSSTLELLRKLTPEIQKALPKGMDGDRIARLVMTEIRKNPKLADCTQISFSGALLNASALGLEPGVLGECYLVPYNDKRRGLECQLIVGYQGIVKLFWQHPRAQGIRTETVYENDTIVEYSKGTGGKFVYQPTLGPRGAIVAYYAEVTIAGVRDPLWGVFTPDEIKDLRRGKVGGSGDVPDPQHWMERKTALKQVLKLAPKTTRLDMAIRADDQAIGGAQQMNITEALSGTPDYVEAEAEPPQAAITPPADVVLASSEQIARLAEIRKAENHDAASWADYVKNVTGVTVKTDAELTLDQAARVIEVFA